MKVSVSIVFSLLGVFLVTSLITGYIGGDSVIDQQRKEIEKLRDENRQLKIDNSILQKYKSEVDEIDQRIANLKSNGFLPDKLLIRYIQRKSREMNISDDFVINVLKTESSLWQFTDGALGEVGGYQILPSTLAHYLRIFGVDESQINIEDYRDLKTNTEWAYVLFLDMRQKKKRLEWKDWNTGFQSVAQK
ncbi:hypothetical protein K1X84_01595 [bacterium]|nr:hypothetical protein [bacterium]